MFGFSVVLVLLWLFEFGLPRELKKNGVPGKIDSTFCRESTFDYFVKC